MHDIRFHENGWFLLKQHNRLLSAGEKLNNDQMSSINENRARLNVIFLVMD